MGVAVTATVMCVTMAYGVKGVKGVCPFPAWPTYPIYSLSLYRSLSLACHVLYDEQLGARKR